MVVPTTSGAGAQAAPSKQTLYFRVTVGPPGDESTCDVVADFWLPAAASPTNPVPVIMATNGFGGSKNDQADLATEAASNRGYAFLSYSGLGFGGSGCEISLDDVDYDGRAGSQLIDWLGGATPTNAFSSYDTNTNTWSNPVPAPTGILLQGDPDDHDPSIGMIGGSYGGQA